MALVESVDLKAGWTIPQFSLPDAKGQNFDNQSLMGSKGLLVIFTCNHCPYAKAIWPRTIELASEAKELGIETVAINPNIHPGYPEDSPEQMLLKIEQWGINFPYLVDQAQEVAKAFDAQCTPDIYLFDGKGALFYHGRLDDNWQDATAVTKQELKAAVTALAEGKAYSERQMPSMGCSIKWK